MSNHASDPEPDRFHRLMTGALDGELSPAEQQEFERLLSESAEKRKEWSEYRKLKDLTMRTRFNDLPEEVWDRYWTRTYVRLERRTAWVLVSIGAMVMLFYGLYHATGSIWSDPHLPWPVKAGILALMAGGVILFFSVLREKLFTRKADKYKEIQR